MINRKLITGKAKYDQKRQESESVEKVIDILDKKTLNTVCARHGANIDAMYTEEYKNAMHKKKVQLDDDSDSDVDMVGDGDDSDNL